jgi:hypothetical protein
MIAVEIAAQVVIRIGLLDSINRKQLSNTYAMIYVVSNTDTFPTSSTLFRLDAAGMKSCYLTVFTMFTVSHCSPS